MARTSSFDFAAIYAGFQTAIAAINCGNQCAPYNEKGVPFCCDIRHAIPTAYLSEWDYLRNGTDLWHIWKGKNSKETEKFTHQVPDGLVLIACLGHDHCERDYRSITCRSFPFFPFISQRGEFLGISYYWEYEDRCWIISNLQAVTLDYISDFITTYEALFRIFPEEKQNFRSHSIIMRRVFSRWRRAIPLFHRNGGMYKVSSRSGRMRRVTDNQFRKHGPYKIAQEMPFLSEIDG